jgi:hypothetical protein
MVSSLPGACPRLRGYDAEDVVTFNVSSRLYVRAQSQQTVADIFQLYQTRPRAGQPVFRGISGRPFPEFISSSASIGFHKKTIIGPLQSSFISAKGGTHELHLARHQGSEARAA